jgi:hypothetical protein
LITISLYEQRAVPHTSFPDAVELDSSWHELLNRMRDESRDKKVRFAVGGWHTERRKFLLSRNTRQGQRSFVTPQEWTEAEERAKSLGIPRLVTTLMGRSESSRLRIPFMNPAELFFLVSSAHPIRFLCLADGTHNLAAFAARDTERLGAIGTLRDRTQGAFIERWTRTPAPDEGWRDFLESAEQLFTQEDDSSVATEIAQKHKLVLYRGRPDRLLQRTYPAISRS